MQNGKKEEKLVNRCADDLLAKASINQEYRSCHKFPQVDEFQVIKIIHKDEGTLR